MNRNTEAWMLYFGLVRTKPITRRSGRRSYRIADKLFFHNGVILVRRALHVIEGRRQGKARRRHRRGALTVVRRVR